MDLINSHDDDEQLDEMADYDTDTLEEIEESRCLDIIDEFKKDIRKQPEFYGIDNISSIEIYNLTCMNYPYTSGILIEEHLHLFDKMFVSIYDYSTTESNYNFIAKKIFKKIYVN